MLKIDFLFLKEKLLELFPEVATLQDHVEVARFACGLTAETQTMLKFVYDSAWQDILEIGLFISGSEFLKSLWGEVSPEEKIDPHHNKYFNDITDWNRDQEIFVPSRHYVLRNIEGTFMTRKVHVDKSSHPSETPPADSVVEMEGNDNLLRILRTINRHQQVLMSWILFADIGSSGDEPIIDDSVDSLLEASLRGNFTQQCSEIIKKDDDEIVVKILKEMLDNENKDVEGDAAVQFVMQLIRCKYEKVSENNNEEVTKLILDTVKISNNIRRLKITECVIPPTAYKHIVSQLHGCAQLEILDLGYTIGVPEELGHCISQMTSLRMLILTRCCVPPSMGSSLTSAISHCTMLTNLLLSGNFLGNCAVNLFTGPGFPDLCQLSLQYTGMSKEDIQSFSTAVRHGKLPKLGALDLSLNSLTDCLVDLFDHPDFTSLDTLLLNDTKVNVSDLSRLSEAAVEGKLGSLENLNLSDNKLTGCIGQLLSSDIPSLKMLKLKNTQLCKNDMKGISKAVREGKLQKLEILQISGNILTNRLRELLNVQYLSLIQLRINETQLTETDMRSLYKAIIEGKLPKLCQLNSSNNNVADSKCSSQTELKSDEADLKEDEIGGWMPYNAPKLVKLSLKGNDLSSMEDAVESLIKTCLPTCKDLEINLSHNNLTEQFCGKIKSLCCNTMIRLNTS